MNEIIQSNSESSMSHGKISLHGSIFEKKRVTGSGKGFDDIQATGSDNYLE